MLTVKEIDACITSVQVLRKEVISVSNDPRRYVKRHVRRIRDLQEVVDAEKAALQRTLRIIRNRDAEVDKYDARLKELRAARVQVAKQAMIERMRELRKLYIELGGGDPVAISEEDIVS